MSKQERPPIPKIMKNWSAADLVTGLDSADMIAHQIVEVVTATIVAGEYPDMDANDETFKAGIFVMAEKAGPDEVRRLASIARIYRTVSGEYMDNLIRLLVETGFLLPETADIPDEVPKDWS